MYVGAPLMGHTVYATYFVPPYFVHILYFQTSKIRCNPLRVLAYCVLCIAYSAANLYSHLKSGLRIWVAFRIPYSVFRIGSTILGGIPYSVFRILYWEHHFGWHSVFRIPYSVLRALFGWHSVFRIPYPYSVLGALWVAFRIPYSVSVFRIGSTLVAFRIPYSVSVFRIGSSRSVRASLN